VMENSTLARGTQAPGMILFSPDQMFYTLLSSGSQFFWAETITQ